MRLDEWCYQNPDKAAELRDRIGRMQLSRYRRGLRPNRSDGIFKTFETIHDVTGGLVTPNDLYGLPPVARHRNGKRARA